MVSARVLGLLTVGAVAVIYLSSLHPSVAGGDSGELMCVAHQLGVAHPPGYPTFLMLTKLISEGIRLLAPSLAIGGAQNACQMLFSVVASACLFHAAHTITEDPWAASLGTFVFSLSPTVWSYAITTEVFPLNNLCCAGLIALAAQYAKANSHASRNRIRRWSIFFSGIALTNQHTSVVLVAPLGAWVLLSEPHLLRRPTELLLSVGLLAAGLSPYLYLPLSAAFRPSVNSWGNTSNWAGFLTHVLRQDYGTFSLAAQDAEYRSSDIARWCTLYLRDIRLQAVGATWLLGVVELIALGTEAMWRDGAKAQPGARAARTLIFAWVTYVAFFGYLSNLPIDQPLFFGVQQRFWMQPFLLICAFIASGFARVRRTLRLDDRFALTVICFVVASSVSAFALRSERDNYFVRDFGRGILDPLPDNSILLTKGDLMINSVRFAQCVEGRRLDVVVLDQELLTFEWYNERVKLSGLPVVLPGRYYFPFRNDTYNVRQLLDANRHAWRRRTFLAVGWKEGDNSHVGTYSTAPFGLSSEIVTAGEKDRLFRRTPAPSKLDTSVKQKYIADLERVLPEGRYSLPAANRYPTSSWEAVILTDTQNALLQNGFAALNIGEDGSLGSLSLDALHLARRLFRRCIFGFVTHPSGCSRNLGVAIQELLKRAPSNESLITEVIEAFSMHLDDIKSEPSEQGNDATAIVHAVEYYKGLVRRSS